MYIFMRLVKQNHLSWTRNLNIMAKNLFYVVRIQTFTNRDEMINYNSLLSDQIL